MFDGSPLADGRPYSSYPFMYHLSIPITSRPRFRPAFYLCSGLSADQSGSVASFGAAQSILMTGLVGRLHQNVDLSVVRLVMSTVLA